MIYTNFDGEELRKELKDYIVLNEKRIVICDMLLELVNGYILKGLKGRALFDDADKMNVRVVQNEYHMMVYSHELGVPYADCAYLNCRDRYDMVLIKEELEKDKIDFKEYITEAKHDLERIGFYMVEFRDIKDKIENLERAMHCWKTRSKVKFN